MESRGPLLDKRQSLWEQKDQHAKQTTSHYSSFPIRSSVSSHDILSDQRRQQAGRTSGAGVWRTPFSQHPTPTPSNQPIRIDIPVSRAVNAHVNPPLTTFQSSALLATKASQTFKVNGNKQSPQSQAHHIYACPVPATKKLPQPSLLSQQQRSNTAKPQVSISPTKHVSFQEPPTQHRQGSKQKHPQELLLCDPWRREAQEKLEKQHRLHVVELLEQEVQELQAKGKRTVEESERLRRLSLEWQFQKRVQEIQQRGVDEEEEEEELDMMLTIQQLEERSQVS